MRIEAMKWKALLFAFVLISCGTASNQAPSAPPTILSPAEHSQTFVKGIGFETTRIEDYEAGVVCYVYDSAMSTGAALSCVPMEQTKLGR